LVVQTAKQRQRDDFAAFRWFGEAWMRAILVQRPMGAVAVKMVQLIGQDTPQEASVEDDHVVQTLAPDRTDHSLQEGILPRRTSRNELLL